MPTDRPKSVPNHCVIDVFCGAFVLSRCFLDFSVSVGAFVRDWVRSLPFSQNSFPFTNPPPLLILTGFYLTLHLPNDRPGTSCIPFYFCQTFAIVLHILPMSNIFHSHFIVKTITVVRKSYFSFILVTFVIYLAKEVKGHLYISSVSVTLSFKSVIFLLKLWA